MRFKWHLKEPCRLAHFSQAELDTIAADLVGRWLVRGGDTVWQDGPATRAVKQGAVLYLDEVAEAREDVVRVAQAVHDALAGPKRDVELVGVGDDLFSLGTRLAGRTDLVVNLCESLAADARGVCCRRDGRLGGSFGGSGSLRRAGGARREAPE